MELDFALLADGVSQRPDGKLDVYGAGFDTILGPAVPVQHPRLTVALRVLISRQEAEQHHELDVILRAVEGNVELARAHAAIAPIPGAADAIPIDRLAGIGMMLGFDNVVFPAYGVYEFVIRWDTADLRHPIRLTVAELPPPAAA